MKKLNLQDFDKQFPKLERENIQLGLLRTKNALKELNNPCKDIPAIQIIGTNGKGSITAFIESILYFSKKNIGVTTSPHLLDISERIRVNKKKIDKEHFEELLKHIKNNLSKHKLSPFEQIICCALKYFDSKKVDILILEAGLGGRLDATTAHQLRPIIAIGNIGFDHKEFLGDSIEEITKEKVAVIEKDSFVVTCRQDMEVEEIIRSKVLEVGAKIIWKESLSNKYDIGLNGSFQKQNAAVALGVIEVLNFMGFNIQESSIIEGFKHTKWPGRLEIISLSNKKVLVDSAHNPSAAKALSKERESWSYEEKGVHWILGVQKQKDISSIIKILAKSNDKILLVPIPNQNSWQLKDISHISEIDQSKIIEFTKFELAFKYLFELNEWPSCHPVLTGSIFLVAEFIKFANNHNI